jgi:nitric oxide reductase subunit C
VRLTLFDRPDPAQSLTLFDDNVTLAPGEVLPLDFVDARTGGDPEAGEDLYYETSLGTNASCRVCHSLQPGVVVVGPSFAGVASRAAERVTGLSAEEYLTQSILEPSAYVVEGFESAQAMVNLGEILTKEQIDDLVAFLMTLE